MTKVLFFSTIACLGLMLTACHHQAPMASSIQSQPLNSETGYSCLVATKRYHGYVTTAWAQDLDLAKQIALNRCQRMARQPSACRIRHCGPMIRVPSIKDGYYTCYARSANPYDVWSGTSHVEARAKYKALDRCQRLSGKANTCYFSHCWFW